MKKVISLILAAVMALSLCTTAFAQKESVKIAIVQQLDHPSLDEIRTAAQARLAAIAQETGVEIEVKEFNGQNDTSILNQIGAQVVQDGYDAVIPIATLAAICMTTATEETDIPVVYAAISDPASAGLTDLDNVTGTSDALNTAFILDMIFAVQPDVKTVGLLYSRSETNSELPIAQAKEYLEEKGVKYIEKTGNTTDEILSAASELAQRCDVVFTPTDNVVMAAESAVAEILTQAGVAHYTGADSFVASGAFATCGVNYTELGEKTAEMAFQILQTGEVPPYHVMEGGIITVNTEVAAQLSIDYAPFFDMANTVNEIETTQE